MVFVYVSKHVSEFPINKILAWIINNYHEQGNIIITNLLLPLGHISNTSNRPLHRECHASGRSCLQRDLKIGTSTGEFPGAERKDDRLKSLTRDCPGYLRDPH